MLDSGPVRAESVAARVGMTRLGRPRGGRPDYRADPLHDCRPERGGRSRDRIAPDTAAAEADQRVAGFNRRWRQLLPARRQSVAPRGGTVPSRQKTGWIPAFAGMKATSGVVEPVVAVAIVVRGRCVRARGR